VRSPAAQWLSAAQLAATLGQTERTIQRWLRAWLDAGSRWVRFVPGRGRYGGRLEAHPSLPARWRRGEMPTPWLATG
jgi:predicted DNA-binding transcriptional regulator YafY